MTNCIINKTNNYIETVHIRPIGAMTDQYEIVIQSQLLDAKDPTALQVKYRTIVSAAALRELRNSLCKIVD